MATSKLRPDKRNANRGTERGRGMIRASLREVGAGRSVVADKNGEVIAGNKTLEAWAEMGGEVEIVHTDGKKLVVVQRDDLDLSDDTGPARKLAYLDNRSSEIGLEWDAEQILADMNSGFDFDGLFNEPELDRILGRVGEETDAMAEWQGMPEFHNEPKAARSLYVHFLTEDDAKSFADLIGQPITGETKSLWYPARPEHLHMDKSLHYES